MNISKENTEKQIFRVSEFAKEKVFWTRKMNIKLVKFIESRPNVWDPKHPKYTSVAFRDQTFSEFASKYGNAFSGQAVKDRWTNIRSTFANYLRKYNASRFKGDGEAYKVNWHLWEACQFLLKVNRKKCVEASTSEGLFKVENNDDSQTSREPDWSSEEEYIESNGSTETMCETVANNLLKVFRGVQNDSFGIDNTKNGKLGRTVATKLSQMDSLNAARASTKILEVLLLYDENNPLNPNNLKS